MVESNTWNLTLILLAKSRPAVPTAPMQERPEGDTFPWDTGWRLRLASPSPTMQYPPDLEPDAESLRLLFVDHLLHVRPHDVR